MWSLNRSVQLPNVYGNHFYIEIPCFLRGCVTSRHPLLVNIPKPNRWNFGVTRQTHTSFHRDRHLCSYIRRDKLHTASRPSSWRRALRVVLAASSAGTSFPSFIPATLPFTSQVGAVGGKKETPNMRKTYYILICARIPVLLGHFHRSSNFLV